MSTLNETIKDIDNKKKQLQETVDSLNDQVEMLKMEGEWREREREREQEREKLYLLFGILKRTFLCIISGL